MKKFSLSFTIFIASFLASEVLAAEQNYPNISGQTFYQLEYDRILSSSGSNVPSSNGFLYTQTDIALNFNKNWSASTQWRLNPNNVYNTRNGTYPERNRTFFSDNRGIKPSDEGLIVEELKVNFKNDDLEFSAGKFDPKFGVANNPMKKLGIFTSQFTYDYYMREKIGANVTALLEDSKITFNSFFNDTTGLSRSAINDRGRASRGSSVAGNTGTLSSYSATMEGKNFMGEKNWFYNLGYRSLGVSKTDGTGRETGYVLGTEYIYEVGLDTTITPFVEVVKIKNFTGQSGRDALYTTVALTMNYSSWNFGVSHLTRNIKQSQTIGKVADNQTQIFIGYKFANNFSLDVTHGRIKEGSTSGSLFGISFSYLQKF